MIKTSLKSYPQPLWIESGKRRGSLCIKAFYLWITFDCNQVIHSQIGFSTSSYTGSHTGETLGRIYRNPLLHRFHSPYYYD